MAEARGRVDVDPGFLRKVVGWLGRPPALAVEDGSVAVVRVREKCGVKRLPGGDAYSECEHHIIMETYGPSGSKAADMLLARLRKLQEAYEAWRELAGAAREGKVPIYDVKYARSIVEADLRELRSLSVKAYSLLQALNDPLDREDYDETPGDVLESVIRSIAREEAEAAYEERAPPA